MTTIVNLTPHAITFVREDGNVVIPSSGIARAATTREIVGEIDGLPVARIVYGEVTGLPEPVEGTIYVVSQITAAAVPDRADVFIVDGTVRDSEGRIVGATGLAHV